MSGCAALWREADAVTDQMLEVQDRIIGTPAVSFAGLIAQLKFLKDFDFPDLDTLIAGVKALAPEGDHRQIAPMLADD
jgi:hypothetical protein